jgi:DNA-binding Lrp family transcriptional regulator
MKIAELLPTPTSIRLLDLLLKHPRGVASQNILADQLAVAPITLRRTLKRLEKLGLVQVDLNPTGVGINAVTFNAESQQGKAVLAFHRRIAPLQPENKDCPLA